MTSVELSRALADRHRGQRVELGTFDPVHSILNFAERPNPNSWSLRAALVRLAQPYPELVSELLAISRRLEAAINPVQSQLFKTLGPADRELTITSITAQPTACYADVRVADLGRLCAFITEDNPSKVAEIALELAANFSPHSSYSLTDVELKALPLVAVASRMERLSKTLTDWADCGPDAITAKAPVDAVEYTSRWGASALDSLGIEAR